MKTALFTLLFLSVFTPPSLYASEVKEFKPSKEEKKLAEYLKGVEFLSEDNALSQEEKAAWYKKLSDVTGISTEQAIKLVTKYKNEPKKWSDILTVVTNLSQDTLKNSKLIINDTLINKENKNGKLNSSNCH